MKLERVPLPGVIPFHHGDPVVVVFDFIDFASDPDLRIERTMRTWVKGEPFLLEDGTWNVCVVGIAEPVPVGLVRGA